MLTRKRLLAFAAESTSGTAESLANADAAFNAFDIQFIPSIAHDKRQGPGSFGHIAATMGMRAANVQFKTWVTGDGAGGVPTWASTFLPSCGWVNDSGTFSPITSMPDANGVETATIAVYADGTIEKIRGAAGTWKAMFSSGKKVLMQWSFWGAYQTRADGSLLTPTYPTQKPLRFAASTFTIGGSAPGCIEAIELDAGNVVEPRPCPTNADGSGVATGLVKNRLPVGKLDPESRLVATEDVWGKWLGGTEEALSIALDDGTDVITFAAPKLQRINVQPGDRNGLQVDQIDFQCNKSAAAGDDELTITFAASA